MGGSLVRRERRALEQQKRRAAKKSAVSASAAPAAPAQSTIRFWLLSGALLVAIVFAYQQAWSAGYIWDDDLYVTQNPLLTAVDGWRRIWFSFDAPSQYFPLTYSTFRIEHALWGFNSAGYHWVNILCHGANALLLWTLLRRLNVRGAWFAAALFALHPVQVESVAWVTERKNVLMGFFFLASLLAWVRFIDEKPNRARWWLALSIVLYLLALSAKTTACTLPAALVLILWWKRTPITARRWMEIAPFVIAGFGAGVISILWERLHQGGRPDAIPIALLERILIGSRAVWFYLSKLAWPADLIFSYPRWEISRAHLADYVWLPALAVLAGTIAYARRWLGRGPEVAFAFFVLTLSPLLGVVIVTTFLYSFVADHYQYLACIGPLALFAAGCDAGIARLSWPGKAIATRTGAVFVLAVLGVLTWQQAKMYRNEETLWLRTIAQNPSSWMSRNQLAAYWVGEKRFEEAIEQYRKIIELRPNDPLGYMNLGAALARKGDADAAIPQYERALTLQPDDPRIERNLAQALVRLGRLNEAIVHFERAVELRQGRKDVKGQNAELELELGNALLQMGRLVEAGAHLKEAERFNLGTEKNAEAFCNLANAFMQKRDLENAVANYGKALAARPTYAEAHSNLGTALLLQGKIAEAISQFEMTLALAPQSIPTLNTFARLLATIPDEKLRDGHRAVRLARQAIELSRGRDPVSFRALAAALAERGEFEQAEKAAEQAINLVGSSNPAFAEALRREKEAYAQHQKAPAS